MAELLNDITLFQWTTLIAAAILIGINKTAIPGATGMGVI